MEYIVAIVLSLIVFISSYFLCKTKIEAEKEQIINEQKDKIEKLEEEIWNLQGKILENAEQIEIINQKLYVPKTKAEKVIDKVIESKSIANKLNATFSNQKK